MKLKTTACEKRLFSILLVFVFEHFFYSSATPIIVMLEAGVNSIFYYV